MDPKDYADALFVQDASNLSGVVHSFLRQLDRIASFLSHSPLLDVHALHRHPIVIMYCSKCVALTEVQNTGVDLRAEGAEALMCAASLLELTTVQVGKAFAHWATRARNTHRVCQDIARYLSELTYCNDIHIFSRAYAACEKAAALDLKGAVKGVVPAECRELHIV